MTTDSSDLAPTATGEDTGDSSGFEERLGEAQDELSMDEFRLLGELLEQNALLRKKLELLKKIRDLARPASQTATQTTTQTTTATIAQTTTTETTQTPPPATTQTTPSVPAQTPPEETDLERSRRLRAEREAKRKAEMEKRIADRDKWQKQATEREAREKAEKADFRSKCLVKFKVAADAPIIFDDNIYKHTAGADRDSKLVAKLKELGKSPEELISDMVQAAAGNEVVNFSQPDDPRTYCRFTIDLRWGGFIGGKVTKADKIFVRHLGPGSKY